MDLGGSTATGPRDANEDNFYVIDFSDVRSFTNGITSFVMVSDGMGGYQGGDIASGLAVSSAESYISQLLDMAAGNQIDLDAAVALSEISQNAHEAILAETRERGNASMGATFVGAFLSPTHAWIGHVGDSRAYLVRGDEATQLTEDHSQVGRMLSRGLITEEEAQNHPARNRIERALGFSDADPEMNEIDLEPGDVLLLCSDGVYTVLDSKAIASCVSGERSAESAAVRVVNKALSKGTDDNSTVAIALNVDSVQEQPRKRKPQQTIRASTVHDGNDQHRARAYHSGGVHRAQVGRDSAHASSQIQASRQPQAYVIPIAIVAVVAIAILVVIALGVGGQGGGGAASSSTTTTPSTASSDPGGEVGSSSPSAAGGGVSASVPGLSGEPQSFLASQDVDADKILKYVHRGKPYKFTEEDAPIRTGISVSLAGGRPVTANSNAISFEVDGMVKRYYYLSSAYREELIQDCSKARQSGSIVSFDSELSKIVGDSYSGFVSELSQYSDLGSIIESLIVSESALVSQS